MAKKTQGLFLGEPWFVVRRFLLPGLILPSVLLMWEILIEPMIPAATDMDLAPVFYTAYHGASALLAIGVFVVGLRLFEKFRQFAQTVIDNDCQNCLRCAQSLAELPAEYDCPACGASYEMGIVVAKWRKAATIKRSALICAKCGKWFVILVLVVGPLMVAGGYYGGLRENRVYEEERQEGVRLHHLGEYAQAEEKFLSALGMAERFFDEQDHRVVESLTDVGNMRTRQGRDSDAIPIFQRALALAEQAFGPEDQDVAVACFALARIYQRQEDYQAAELHYQRAIKIFKNRPGTRQRVIRQAIEPYIELLRATDRNDEADRLEVDKYYGPEPADAVVLDVPYVSQKGLTDCVPTCVSMMLRYHNIEFNAFKVRWETTTDPQHGSNTYHTMQYLKKLGAEPTVFYPPDVDDLIRLVRSGIPVMVVQRMSRETRRIAHAVVVVGATKSGDTLVLHDPYYGKRVSLDVDTFDRRWILGGDYCRKALFLSPGQAGLPEGLNPAYAHIAEQFELGRLFAATKDTKKAITIIQKTIQSEPDFIPGYLYLAKCFLIEDRDNEAVEAFRKALELDDTYCWGMIRFNMAAVQWTLGQEEEARLNLKKFLAGNPSGLPEEVRQARAVLSELGEPTEVP